MIKIKTSEVLQKKLPLVLLEKKEKMPEASFFSKEEYQYLKQMKEKDEKTIVVNRYTNFVIVHFVNKSTDDSYAFLEECRKAGARVNETISRHSAEVVQVSSSSCSPQALMACAEGLSLASYRFTRYLTTNEKKKTSLKEIVVVHKSLQKKEAIEVQTLIEAVYKARDLVNEPANHLNAVQLAQALASLCKEAGCKTEILNKKQIESLRMGGLLAVNRGSVDPPSFTIMEWKPAQKVNKQPLVLVGKGLVYDTGGLSLKPTQDSMDYMKSDMAGAAAVACALYAIAMNRLPIHVIALAPSTDNRPGFNAYAPGDIIRMYNGMTVENMNSDAEGRMILADAIAYAKKYNPELLINVATLTGSASMAVGPYAMVAMGTADRKVMDRLKECGEKTWERMVEFPLWDEYGEMLKSDIADLRNIGGRSAGAIVGGKFLEKFAPCPFIHLDIAGIAFNKTAEGYKPKGGTGACVRLLYHFARQLADQYKNK